MYWSVRPFVRILIFFIAGIMIAVYIPAIGNNNLYIWLPTISILTISAITFSIISLKHRFRWLPGLLICLTIMVLGTLLTSIKLSEEQHINLSEKNHTYLGNIISNPSETNQAVKAVILVSPVIHDSLGNSKHQKALCYLRKNNLSSGLRYGDIISFRGILAAPKGPQNPEEFDYAKYLKQNSIFSTAFINERSWKLLGNDPLNPVIAFAGKLRENILNTLGKYGLSGGNYAVAAAVLLGYDDYMEYELKQDYIMAGAMHILCVSGLHVGIIYLVINFLLGFLANRRTNNIIKAILLLIAIWAYAIITGLSPSVQRASLMLSVFIIGNLLKRNRDTYNTLAISAFILLIFDPNLLFNVGFQLSYAAVIGIVTLHQPIYKLLYFKNTIVDKIWSITVLSFSAQLATFPIATYYFHFFPPWFWLTNLFTFPLSFLIIATGLAFVLTMWIPFISQLIGWLLSGFIYLLNYGVGIVKYLPLSGIDHIYTSLPMVFSIYLLFIFIFIMINTKKINLLLPSIIIISIIISLSTYHKYSVESQNRIVVYNIKNHSAFDFIEGGKHVLTTDSILFSTKSKINYHLKNSRTTWGIDNEIHKIPANDTILNDILFADNNFIVFNNKKLFINNGMKQLHTTNTRLPIDIVIFSGRKSSNIDQLLLALDFNSIIIDSSVPWWNQKKISESANTLGISCYNVNRKGAFILNL